MSDTTAIKTATSSLSQKENDCGLEIRGGYHLDQHTALKKCNVATSEIPGQIDSVESESEDTALTNVETGPRMTLRSMTIKNGKAIECGSATITLFCLLDRALFRRCQYMYRHLLLLRSNRSLVCVLKLNLIAFKATGNLFTEIY